MNQAIPKFFVFVIVSTLLMQVGCVKRRMTVRTVPAGATVYIDQQEVGTSPVSVPFTYYGTREFTIEKDGFQTIKQLQRVRPPWYQIPPLDFVSENLWPRKIRDERIIDFQLQPQLPTDERQLQINAEQLRNNVRQGVSAPGINGGQYPYLPNPGLGY